MAKLQDKFFNRVIEGDLELGQNEKNQVVKAVEDAPALKVFENITDSEGHKRFVEGDIDIIGEISGLTKTYGKWSLSGSHLMIVIAGEVAENTTLNSQTSLFVCSNLPSWVYDKIATLKGIGVAWNTFTVIAPDWTPDNTAFALIKNDGLKIQIDETKTYTDGGVFRVVFDLLIDNA